MVVAAGSRWKIEKLTVCLSLCLFVCELWGCCGRRWCDVVQRIYNGYIPIHTHLRHCPATRTLYYLTRESGSAWHMKLALCDRASPSAAAASPSDRHKIGAHMFHACFSTIDHNRAFLLADAQRPSHRRCIVAVFLLITSFQIPFIPKDVVVINGICETSQSACKYACFYS